MNPIPKFKLPEFLRGTAGILCGLLFILIVLLGTMFARPDWFVVQPRPGVVVLSSSGCDALNRHGLSVDPLGPDGLCVYSGSFFMDPWRGLEFQGDDEVFVSTRHVVSWTEGEVP